MTKLVIYRPTGSKRWKKSHPALVLKTLMIAHGNDAVKVDRCLDSLNRGNLLTVTTIDNNSYEFLALEIED